MEPNPQKIPPAPRVPEPKICRKENPQGRTAYVKTLLLFLATHFGQHWRQETGLHGPATAKIIRDVLGQSFLLKEISHHNFVSQTI